MLYEVGCFEHPVWGVSMLISIENNPVPFDEMGHCCFPLQNIHTSFKLVDFCIEIKQTASKINSTLQKTEKPKTIKSGQQFISPGRDFHLSNTLETLWRNDKMVNNQKF